MLIILKMSILSNLEGDSKAALHEDVMATFVAAACYLLTRGQIAREDTATGQISKQQTNYSQACKEHFLHYE